MFNPLGQRITQPRSKCVDIKTFGSFTVSLTVKTIHARKSHDFFLSNNSSCQVISILTYWWNHFSQCSSLMLTVCMYWLLCYSQRLKESKCKKGKECWTFTRLINLPLSWSRCGKMYPSKQCKRASSKDPIVQEGKVEIKVKQQQFVEVLKIGIWSWGAMWHSRGASYIQMDPSRYMLLASAIAEIARNFRCYVNRRL